MRTQSKQCYTFKFHVIKLNVYFKYIRKKKEEREKKALAQQINE